VELPRDGFDILFSRFGVMFFDDPTGAFAHMRRPPGRSARRIWENAPVGSSKNITPKRENRMSNAPWGSAALPASAT
jgi:hypothetical protein